MPDEVKGKPEIRRKNPVDPFIPYHFLQEQEPGPKGNLQRVNTVFLSGRECAFRCIMCDLWKNTLPGNTPAGAIPIQIDYALARLPQAEGIKLYNSSNFFDRKAVPVSDYAAIGKRVQTYQRVIVENHPRLCNDDCLAFRDELNGQLEIAMGLETIHPDVLPKLNKQLQPEDFSKACAFLKKNGIQSRAFVLLNPPFLTDEAENRRWSLSSIRFAFESGVDRCTLIPTRPGTAIMNELEVQGRFLRPGLAALEDVFEEGLRLGLGQLFVDTWDLSPLSDCPACFQQRKMRLDHMNLSQQILPRINCDSCNYHD